MEIRQLGPDDTQLLLEAAHLFDENPSRDRASAFLASDNSSCLVAYIEGEPAGFVTGIDIRHPDKATEMLLYEIGVDRTFRGRGIGSALVEALSAVATNRGHRGMWVLTDEQNDHAMRMYRAAGAGKAEPALLFEWDLAER